MCFPPWYYVGSRPFNIIPKEERFGSFFNLHHYTHTICTWQWFRVTAEGNVVKISNATKQSYTVGAIDSGAVLYCEATDTNGNLLKSNESSVMKATNITEINVNGMTGQRPGDKDEFVAVAGDELEVELVPYGAANDAEYQWYRGGAAIKGATEKTYIPTTADVNLDLSVKVTIPATAGYGISVDATTTNKSLEYGTVYTGANYTLAATVTLDDVVCWDLSNSTPLLDNTEPAVGDTITVKVPFDKNGDGDETDTGDYLDLTSDDPDATVAWYRGSIEAKNKVGSKASYDVAKEDNGKALYAVVTGANGSEFIGSCEATTDEANKTIMNTVISRETTTVTTDADNYAEKMTKGAKLYAATKDNNNDSVKDANLTFQWYRGGAAIEGATSSSYTLGDDDIKKFKDTATVTYKVVVTGKDGYTGTAKDDIAIKGQPSTDNADKVTKEDISIKRGDKYLAVGDVLNAGDELTLAASFADSLGAMNVVWWYNPDTAQASAETYTGTSFTVPSDATTSAKVAVSLTKKADESMWDQINLATCTTNKTSDVKESQHDGALNTQADTAIAGFTTQPTTWAAVAADTTPLACAKSLDSIAVTYKVGDRTLTAPEVGATMTVSVKPQLAGLEYTWEVGGTKVDSNDKDADEDNPTIGNETGEGANAYTIKSADVNKKIKVTVKATTGGTYSDASIKYESEEVAASSRTIAAIKVLRYDATGTKGTDTDTWYVKPGDKNGAGKADFLNDKADFTNKKSVSRIANNENYIIVAMDSDGELVNYEDAYYNIYNFKSGVEKKVNGDQRFYGGLPTFATGDVPHFEVAPNQIGYTGSSVSYNLTSAVSDGGTGRPKAISITIAPATSPAAGTVNEAKKLVKEGTDINFKATVTGVTGNPSIKWFKGNGDQVKVGQTYNPKALTETGDGSFYAEITVDGTTYTSNEWEIQNAVATAVTLGGEAKGQSVAATLTGKDNDKAAGTGLKFTVWDQFDAKFTTANTDVFDITVTGGPTAAGALTGACAIGGKNEEALTITPTNNWTTAGATTFTVKATLKDNAGTALVSEGTWTVTGTIAS